MPAVVNDVRRLSNRAWRELIARVPPIGQIVGRVHDNRLARYRPYLATLAPAQQELLSEIVASGVAVTDLELLGLSGTAALKESLSRMVAALAARPRSEASPVRPTRAELLAELDLWQWGLREDVLDLVERHLGLPARYYGADVRREGVNGEQAGVRFFHRDIEDFRVFKILVWLDDVGPEDGAFQWVPPELTASTTQALRYVAGYVTDTDMSKIVSPEHWRTAEGPQWTALMADTRSVFHRAGRPQHKDRYSVTFSWTSRHPVKTMPTKPFTASETARLRSGLNDRQLACLPLSLR